MTTFRGRVMAAVLACVLPVAVLAEADGKWLSKVPEKDRAAVNPMAGNAEAAQAGGILFEQNCAKCHGKDAEGLHGRPSLHSQRVQHATDGELAWILKNGEPFKGMPRWSALPEQQRWQIIAYLRTLRANPVQTSIPAHN